MKINMNKPNASRVPRIASILRMPSGMPSVIGADSQSVGHAPIQKTEFLNVAYDEFCRRIEAGEVVDPVSFCNSQGRYRTELLRRIELHNFLDANPETLDLLEPIPWPAIGDQLGDATILEELGRGGVGRVYLAQDNSLPRRYVIKASAFENGEARRLSRLDHPNVVPIYFVDEDEHAGLSLIVMPLQSRRTLHDVLDFAFAGEAQPTQWSDVADRLFPEALDASRQSRKSSYRETVLKIAAEISEALQHCHDHGIYHFDLKPSNILLLPDGSPVLIDFGVGEDTDHDVDTNAEVIGGTKPYMSPEQIRKLLLFDGASDAPQGKSDVYSLGVMLCQLLTGEHPFSEVAFTGTEEQLLLQQQAWKSDDLISYDLSPALKSVLRQCLALDPAERPTAGELSKSLGIAIYERTRKIRRRSFMAAMAGGALAVGALNPEVSFKVGRMHRERRNWQGALDALDRAIEMDGENIKYLTARASVYLMRAWETLDWDPVLGITPAILGGAMADFGFAHSDYEVASKYTVHPAINACLAYTEYLRREHEMSLDQAKRARKAGFENSAIANIEGIASRRSRRPSNALSLAVKRYPGDQTALLNYSYFNRSLARNGKVAAIQSGLRNAQHAFRIGPARVSVHYELAFYLACDLQFGDVADKTTRRKEICNVLIEGLKLKLHTPAQIKNALGHIFDVVLDDAALQLQMKNSANVAARRFVRMDHPLGVGNSAWIHYLDV